MDAAGRASPPQRAASSNDSFVGTGPDEAGARTAELLLLAVEQDSVPEVMRLLTHRADVNATTLDPPCETPLCKAVSSQNEEIVAALLLHRADPRHASCLRVVKPELAGTNTTQGLLALFGGSELLAAHREAILGRLNTTRSEVEQHLKALYRQRLIAEGHDIADHDLPEGFVASSGDSSESSRSSSNGWRSGGTPLQLAVERKDFVRVCRLLQEGVDVQASGVWDEPPLFEAAGVGDADIVAALLLWGADPDHVSPAGLIAEDLAPDLGVRGLLRLFRGLNVDAATVEAVRSGLSSTVRRAVALQLWHLEDWPQDLPQGQPQEPPPQEEQPQPEK